MHYELDPIPVSHVIEPGREQAAPATPAASGTSGCLIAIVVLVVLLSIAAVVLAIVIPNIISAQNDAKKTQDISNLKMLTENFIAGQAMGMKTPRSNGWRFWVALYVGDAPGTENGFFPESSDVAYLPPNECRLLISPADSVPDAGFLENEMAYALGNGGASLADQTWTSYAGPSGGHGTFKRRGTTVVGATGTRGGVPMFADGFSMVYSNASAEFVDFDEMAAQYGWPHGTQDWGDEAGPLAGLTNIEDEAE